MRYDAMLPPFEVLLLRMSFFIISRNIKETSTESSLAVVICFVKKMSVLNNVENIEYFVYSFVLLFKTNL